MSEQVMPSYRFPIILGVILAVLLASLFVQTLLLMNEAGSFSAEAPSTSGDVVVLVGEMFFRQEGLEADNVLEASVGEIIEFVNVGGLPHTVTIEALGVDAFLEPGDSVLVRADSVLDEALVNCRLHARHEARLSVS